MTDRLDIFADGSNVTVSAFGASLTFTLAEPHATSVNPPPPSDLVTVRLSNEHLKVLSFLLWRAMRGFERENQVTVAMPVQTLGESGIPHEDWEAFWR